MSDLTMSIQYVTLLRQFITDIQITIAAMSPTDHIWYLLYLYDPNFRIYAESPAGCILFQESFIEHKIINNVSYWTLFDKYHNINDKPAIINPRSGQSWYIGGNCHRDDDKPAIEYSDGTKIWRQHGKCHRDNDQPATVLSTGDQYWYKHGIEYIPSEKI